MKISIAYLILFLITAFTSLAQPGCKASTFNIYDDGTFIKNPSEFIVFINETEIYYSPSENKSHFF